MSEYYTEEFKQCYKKLGEVKGSLQPDCETLELKFEDIDKKIDVLVNSSMTSNWEEQGATEFSKTTTQDLKNIVKTIKKNITYSLKGACDIVVKSLYPALEEMKVADEEYDEIQQELNDLVEPTPTHDSEGRETTQHFLYVTTKNDLETSLTAKRIILELLKNRIERYMGNVKDKDSLAKDVTISSGVGSRGVVDYSSNKNLTLITYNGKQYWVINTKIPVTQYAEYVKSEKIWQRYILGGECMLLSQYYAVDMMRGTFTSQSQMKNVEGSPSTRINNKCLSTKEEDILKFIYDEALSGRATALQATQVDPLGRHVVTVVGFDPSVRSYKDLTPDKIFVLDCADSDLQTLDKHNRKLKATGEHAYYQAIGATKDFLEQEVYV